MVQLSCFIIISQIYFIKPEWIHTIIWGVKVPDGPLTTGPEATLSEEVEAFCGLEHEH